MDNRIIKPLADEHNLEEIETGHELLNIKKRHYNMVLDAIEIDKEEAIKAGSLGFVHRGLTLCSMPYKDLKGQSEYSRTNGYLTMSILSPKNIGIPFGNIPRLIHIFIATEAVKTKSKEILLGNSMSDFMHKLGLNINGGKRGDITRLNNQLKKLLISTIHLIYTTESSVDIKNMQLTSSAHLLWNPKSPSQNTLWGSYLELSKEYFNDLIDAPVPLDLRAVKALKQSSLELDIYFWLTHRMFYLRKPSVIPYELLQMQFGSDYKRLRKFKEKFLIALKHVQYVWQDLKISEEKEGLKIMPSKLLVKPKH